IGEGQTISQPYTVAYQTQLLEVKRNDKILEVGTGSIYQSTVLAEMGAKVFTIERQKKLFLAQKDYYFKNKYLNIKFFYGDGFEGLPTFAQFDKIIITAAAPFIPPKLVQQLKVGGYMVIPVDEGNTQRMLRLTKQTDGTMVEEAFENFSFVPMLGGKNG
ncbi:MAG: protein-L-isoaspartate O-methyltransferase, partial [Pedobacter sp.]|nr:protein-L-isoaspartate O-methyltransferase [Chitinophagaceae bacterium]